MANQIGSKLASTINSTDVLLACLIFLVIIAISIVNITFIVNCCTGDDDDKLVSNIALFVCNFASIIGVLLIIINAQLTKYPATNIALTVWFYLSIIYIIIALIGLITIGIKKMKQAS